MRGKIGVVVEINVTADELVRILLAAPVESRVCILDGAGVGITGANRLIAGIWPVDTGEVYDEDPREILSVLDNAERNGLSCIFTLGYDLGKRLEPRLSANTSPSEPYVFFALFDTLIVHDYDTGRTFVIGPKDKTDAFIELCEGPQFEPREFGNTTYGSDHTREDYMAAVDRIKEFIACGDTYQTNLTQQISSNLSNGMPPEQIFWNLRRDNPAPYSAFIRRFASTVISASPESFLRIDRPYIKASPIKGTRPRGLDRLDDERLRTELLSSEKDRAENVMIVDLLRNDLGKVCEFGSVSVGSLCEIAEHPTLFHLVSTVEGRLRESARLSDIIRATFPCGSITGAPKIRTMQIIDEIERSDRGLSMGAIGLIYAPATDDRIPSQTLLDHFVELSVAIRTITVTDGTAAFNVGGGIVIDSDPADEYAESMLKAKALLRAMGGIDQ